jgi:hypothetical protein
MRWQRHAMADREQTKGKTLLQFCSHPPSHANKNQKQGLRQSGSLKQNQICQMLVKCDPPEGTIPTTMFPGILSNAFLLIC